MEEPTNALEAALKQLIQERADLDAAIAALEKRLGRLAATVPLASLIKAGSGEVFRGEFFGLSVTKAAEKLLKRVGHALKTPEILDSFQRAGYEIKGKTPRATVYTSLARSKGFVKVLPDTWALAEWHPEAAAFKESEAAKARKPRRAKRRRRGSTEKPEGPQALKTVA